MQSNKAIFTDLFLKYNCIIKNHCWIKWQQWLPSLSATKIRHSQPTAVTLPG